MSDRPRFADMIGTIVEVGWKGDPGGGYRARFELLAVDRDLRMVALRGVDDPPNWDECDGLTWYPLGDVESISPEDAT